MSDEYLRRSVRTISAIQYFISFLVFDGGILALVLLAPAHELSLRHAAILVIVGMAVFLFLLARSLRQFRPWARTATIVLSCIGVLVIPFGTAIYGPFLYILVKAKHLFPHVPQPCDPSASTPA